MKAFRALRTISSNYYRTTTSAAIYPRLLSSVNAQHDDEHTTPTDDSENDVAFDSGHFALPTQSASADSSNHSTKRTWDDRYRNKVKNQIFGEDNKDEKEKEAEQKLMRDRVNAMLARTLLDAAVTPDYDENNDEVKEEDQKSLSVGIIGAPNAGKSALTNFMVGNKVSAVSRKTNTTSHEVLGVMTKGDTQICFFDTPGLMLTKSGYPHKDVKVRVESVWSAVDLYDVLVVIFDVHRHLDRKKTKQATSMLLRVYHLCENGLSSDSDDYVPRKFNQLTDSRVVQLIKRMGEQVHPRQKRVLCMNKVDLVVKKKDLLQVAGEFKDLPGYERYFMISGLKGSGVKDLTQYLMEQAVKRPWDEDSVTMSEEVMKNISLEVVRERLMDHIHQEIPYDIQHRLIDWKELRDGSLRIEQHFITSKLSQRGILVGKNGSKIGRIGIEANEELRNILKRDIHLILQVRVKRRLDGKLDC